MRKSDDCTLSKEQYDNIKQEAKRALEDAGAVGVFPTPVSDIMSSANVHEVHEDVLNESFVAKIRKEVGSALRQALSKVIGLFDARSRLVFIDRSLHEVKQTFIRLHETAHGYLGISPVGSDLSASSTILTSVSVRDTPAERSRSR